MHKRKTKEKFIFQAKEKHGDKYDYSKIEYKNTHSKIEIFCNKHGSFFQIAKNHLNGFGCPSCSNNLRLNNELFIQKSKEKHGNKYDYSKTIYKGSFEPVIITCKKHGDFETKARHHYYKGYGCPQCHFDKPAHNRLTKKEFIKRSIEIHKGIYDYSNVNYLSCNDKVEIICKKHGIFLQTPSTHLAGCGCKKCSSSIGEKIISKFLTDINLEFIPQKKFDDCRNPKSNHKLEFDFYIPKLNILIEYDGMQHFEPIKYWGGNKRLEDIKYRDGIKNKYCLDNNVPLYRISYKENIEEKLKNILNLM